MRGWMLCLLFSASFVAVNSASAGDSYSVMGLVHPAVDWDCTGIFCDETTASAVLLGFGESIGDAGLFYQGDAFYTVSKGEVETFADSGSYAVHGYALYAGWRSHGSVSLLLKAGFGYTQVDGPEDPATDSTGFGVTLGAGVMFGEHLEIEWRALNERVNTLNANWHF